MVAKKRNSGDDIQAARAILERALRLLDERPADLRAVTCALAAVLELGFALDDARKRLEAQARGREPRLVEVAGRRWRVLEGGAGR